MDNNYSQLDGIGTVAVYNSPSDGQRTQSVFWSNGINAVDYVTLLLSIDPHATIVFQRA